MRPLEWQLARHYLTQQGQFPNVESPNPALKRSLERMVACGYLERAPDGYRATDFCRERCGPHLQ